MIHKILYCTLFLIFLNSCLKPYEVDPTGYEELLVVDGLITNDNQYPQINITRTTQNIEMDNQPVSNAIVTISDNEGHEVTFQEIAPGLYQPTGDGIYGLVGDVYQLYIKTPDQKEYLSSKCEMLPPSQINAVYFDKDKKWNIESTTENVGVSIFTDGQIEGSNYIRWIYEETWKFQVPYPYNFAFDIEKDEPVFITPENVMCWKSIKSNTINIHSSANQTNENIKQKKILFIPTELSDKLSIRYSILLKQLTISKDEYHFWSKLKKSTENNGDIFGKQPFSITSNITNINDPQEPVLGYFQVGSVVSKRIYINYSDANKLGVPDYDPLAYCQLDTFKITGYLFKSLRDIYNLKILHGSYEGISDLKYTKRGDVLGFLLTIPECADCSRTGSINPPPFWEE